MRRTVVRYKVKPERAEENAEFVRAVYAELQELQPPGFRYSTFQLEDGVSFVHVAISESDQVPLPALESFKRFQEGLKERCDEAPLAARAELVGSYEPG
ncbi:MAG: hypothetical protein QOI10_186 [Solirubrobacterales bacterium]|jgi:hypothetical protein|nr:hypothetical protein [Solirubrobacterales bacterium]